MAAHRRRTGRLLVVGSVVVFVGGLGVAGRAAAPSPVLAGAPRLPAFVTAPRLQIASLGVDAPIITVPSAGGLMQVPGDVGAVGWLDSSAHVDDALGSSVVAGHVSDDHGSPGALGRLTDARVGDRITWREGTRSFDFVVRELRTYPRDASLPESVFETTGPHVLTLITCTDRVQRGDRWHYRSNLVVTADPA